MNRISSILLDLDGTLIDSALDISDSINDMRKDLNLENLPIPLIKSFIGSGIDNLIKRSLDDYNSNLLERSILLKQGKEFFFKYHHEHNGQKTDIYEGVIEGLHSLKKQKFKLSIVTNKPTKLTMQILQKMNLIDLFSCIVCGDTCTKCKPEPDQILFACKQLNVVPNKSIMVGDSINDVLAAKSAKTAAVLVLPYGYHNRDNITELNADGIIQDLTKVSDWIHSYNNSHFYNVIN